jgi:hypothetical protein
VESKHARISVPQLTQLVSSFRRLLGTSAYSGYCAGSALFNVKFLEVTIALYRARSVQLP